METAMAIDRTDDAVDEDRVDDRADYGDHRRRVVDDAYARDKFGGINWGAAFFGWLVAMGIAILLSSIVGAITAAVGSSNDVTQTQAQRQAGTIGITAAIVLVIVLLIAYYTGGYVAGRMSRFDGGRQGLAVWLIGLIVTILAVVLGVAFGSKYNILDRVSLPRMPIPTDQLTTGGVITGIVVLVGTLLLAMAGGKVGHRYHDRVDRAAYR
jgi:amino acid transporter